MMNRQEFEDAILSPHCMDFWNNLDRNEVTGLLGEDVGNMVGFDQRNPHHCFDLLLHSLHTVEGVRQRTSEMPIAERKLLLCAAFFHDIGKIASAKVKDNRLVFYGHSLKSAEITQLLLEQMGYAPTEIKKDCFLIAHHDDFISFVTPQEFRKSKNQYYQEISERNIVNHINFVESTLTNHAEWYDRNIWNALCILCQADVDGQATIVKLHGKVVDSQKHKYAKIAMIQAIIKHAR